MAGKRVKASLEFKAADFWLGLYWKPLYAFLTPSNPHADRREQRIGFAAWICLLPCLPIHVEVRSRP